MMMHNCTNLEPFSHPSITLYEQFKLIVRTVCDCSDKFVLAPNPSSTGDKGRLGADPGDGSTDPLTMDKGFYENLPFHGMQNPPNKVQIQIG